MSNTATGRRLPADGDVQPGTRRGLGRTDGVNAKRRVERIAESKILVRLQLNEFDPNSDDWKLLRDALIEYGHAVLVGWGVRQKLRSKAAAHSGVVDAHRIPEGLRLSRDEAESLAIDVLIKAIDSFRVRVLAQNRWQPDRGASLTTYFIGWCLMLLPTAFEQWVRREHAAAPDGIDLVDRRAPTPVEDAAVAVLELEAARDVIDDPQLIEMFELRATGHSDQAIAARLGLTEAAVRTRISRARQRMKAWKEQHFA